ncbi:MAG: hypothetical protein HYV37_00455 [Candidatus Levyibacteriota bacterium]|nr:MAG: hypothetical protein HYV37_00455 [Candidatus Levybacteria bacterium]
MDSNQTELTQPVQQPVVETTNGRSRKGLILFLIMLLIIFLGAGTIYIAANRTATTSTLPTTKPVIQQPTITKPSPTIVQTPEEELGQINVENPDTDVQDIQADIQQL